MARVQINYDEIEKAKKWLVENMDAWEENRLLVPESEVPYYVVKYFAFWDELSDVHANKMRIINSMDTNQDEEVTWDDNED